MRNDFDIIIIGGGLLGCSTAYHLAKSGSGRILLVERHEIASQASSRAACMLTRARTSQTIMKMVQETYDCIEEIQNILGESLGLQQCGSVTIASSENSLKMLEKLEAASDEFGIPNSRIDRGKVRKLLPWINPDAVDVALYMPTDSFIDCAVLCSGYARAAVKLGVEERCHEEVKEILVRDDRVEGICLSNGEHAYAPVIVNASGSWANLLMRPLKIGLPFTPVRSHFWISDIDEKLFPTGHPFTVIPDARAFTRSDLGALIIGLRESTCRAFDPSTLTDTLEDFDFGKEDEWKVLDECAPLLKKYLPCIDDLPIAHYMMGPSCYVPDSKFVIGPVAKCKGLYAVAGCCGAGVACGGGMGRLAAELIRGDKPFVEPSLFSPDRFGEVDPFSHEFQQRCAEARSNKRGG